MSISAAEFEALHNNYVQAKTELYELKEQLNKVSKREKTLKDELETANGKIKALEGSKSDLSKSTLSRFDSLINMSSSKDSKKLTSLNNEFEEFKRNNSQIIEDYKSQNEALKQSVKNLYSQLQQAQANQNSENPNNGENESKANTTIQLMEGQIVELKSAMEKDKKDLERVMAMMASKDELIFTAKEEAQNLSNQNSKLKNTIKELETKLNNQQNTFPVAQAVSMNNQSSLSPSNNVNSMNNNGPSSPPPPGSPEKVSMSDNAPLVLPNTLEEAITQIKKLNSEVNQLQTVKEHFITSIQKKDASVKSREDELDRMMAAVSEKDSTIFNLREQLASLDSLQREIKNKDARIKKLESNEGASEKLSALSLELHAAHASISNLQHEYDSVKADLEEMKDQLFLHETQALDRGKLLASTDEALAKSKEENEKKMVEINNLSEKINKMEIEFQQDLIDIEKALKADKAKVNQEFETQKAELLKEKNKIHQDFLVASETLASREIFIDNLERSHNTLKDNYSELLKKHETTCQELSSVNDKLAAVEVEIEADSKKRNSIVWDLKKQLKKEAIKNKELEAQLSEARDDLQNLKVKLKNKALSSSDLESLLSDSKHDDSTAPPSVDSSVLSEVSDALTRRVASLQDQNFELQRQIKSATLHRQLLEEDVEQKKMMIRNLVRRIEMGQLQQENNPESSAPTTGSDLYRSLSTSEKDILFDRMEKLVQETVVENHRTKQEVRQLGEEITRINQQFKEEMEAVKRERDEALEEIELSQQSSNDSAKLVLDLEAKLSAQLEENKLLNAKLSQIKDEASQPSITSTPEVSNQNIQIYQDEILELKEKINLLNLSLENANNQIQELSVQLKSNKILSTSTKVTQSHHTSDSESNTPIEQAPSRSGLYSNYAGASSINALQAQIILAQGDSAFPNYKATEIQQNVDENENPNNTQTNDGPEEKVDTPPTPNIQELPSVDNVSNVTDNQTVEEIKESSPSSSSLSTEPLPGPADDIVSTDPSVTSTSSTVQEPVAALPVEKLVESQVSSDVPVSTSVNSDVVEEAEDTSSSNSNTTGNSKRKKKGGKKR